MEFNLNENREVVALLGAGSMGTAIIKRISTNRIILLGDINEDNLKAREEELKYNGYAAQAIIVALSVQYFNGGIDKSTFNSLHSFSNSLLKYLFALTPPATISLFIPVSFMANSVFLTSSSTAIS